MAKEAFGLYLILTDPVAGYEACAKAAVRAGLAYLQLRMKNKPDEEVLAVARELRAITAGTATRLIINDSVWVAKEMEADGVHLGVGDMPIQIARAVWTAPGKIFGLSTHDEDQESRARQLQPDYIGVGPVYATPTKATPDPTVGLERMGKIIRNSPLTCVAIGGIDADNLDEVLAHGAVNFAVVRAVNQAREPYEAIQGLMEIWRAKFSR